MHQEATMRREPNAELAAAIASRVTGCTPSGVRRFTTGARHNVFDVQFTDRSPVVARIGDTASRHELAGAIYLSGLLRPRGVLLPTLLAEDIQSEFPWMLLERLPGKDLGAIISRLPDEQLDSIAANVVQAQTITANTGSAGRYGYAARAEHAPQTTWSEVLLDNLARSRRRIETAGLFDISLVEIVQVEFTARRGNSMRLRLHPFCMIPRPRT